MVKVYLDEVENKANELVNYSKNDISLKIEDMKNLTDKFIWKGQASESFISGYKNKINKLAELNNKMSKIAEFLFTVNSGYQETNERVNNMYEELVEEFKKAGVK